MSQLRIDPTPPHNGVQRIAVSGRLDAGSYPELDQALDPLLADDRVSSVVLDLEGLNYINSAGIRSLERVRRALAARHRAVLLVNPQPQVRKVLDVVEAVPVEEVFASYEEADAYFDVMQRRLVSKVAAHAPEAGADG
ncbi:anti-sigma factor antagonist [Pseudoxanthomonas sp. SGNA-20]|jgi:Anti-anti-sigma regulatory factor (antagonist of anti-sigma factor)|uniref:STAS domain-containing protein n=1 Tax=unclassified Pseudoxanthomonas TaxID=2645906 RepID=UPI00030504DB|nr:MULTISPECIES: STAS domain-containing protein [unclassified Pseudoxanthomonas]RRN55649.1 anti-sigma factor antagonist [Pseudoxanthomonas sp. SGNA-20]RRN79395.1 anti-sigma factor antagonist [Pseudoxanthomonas sp. SGD-10]